MNKYNLLLLVIITAFFSCDGRYRVNKTPVEVLTERNLLNSFSENIKYFPKEYTETSTDTILSNGYHVKVKNYTDMEHSVVKVFKKNTHHYRKVISEIEVFKDNKQIFKHIINESFLSAKTTLGYINHEIYVDQSKSLETNTLHLIASQCIPKSKNCPIYNITIQETGNYKIERNS